VSLPPNVVGVALFMSHRPLLLACNLVWVSGGENPVQWGRVQRAKNTSKQE
jgi:hypothetical protein